jgi:tRNA A37 threonylcarbamoyladenosine dehydratase
MSEWSWLARTELLVGKEKVEKLNRARVMVVGLGGVGSFAAEFLCRAGIGRMTIIDGDTVDRSNKNRQLPALDSTIGQEKAQVMAARMRDISPELELLVIPHFQEPDNMARLLQEEYDFVLDCIDSLQPKIQLITTCLQAEQPFISSMGAGGRYNPEFIRIAPLGKTHQCPFAQQVRKSVRRQGFSTDFPVVFSDEPTLPGSMEKTDGTRYKKSYYGTISYMPALFGLYMASYVIRKTMEG